MYIIKKTLEKMALVTSGATGGGDNPLYICLFINEEHNIYICSFIHIYIYIYIFINLSIY